MDTIEKEGGSPVAERMKETARNFMDRSNGVQRLRDRVFGDAADAFATLEVMYAKAGELDPFMLSRFVELAKAAVGALWGSREYFQQHSPGDVAGIDEAIGDLRQVLAELHAKYPIQVPAEE